MLAGALVQGGSALAACIVCLRADSSGAGCAGTYAGLCERLDYLAALGVNAVELMPVHEFNELEYYKVQCPALCVQCTLCSTPPACSALCLPSCALRAALRCLAGRRRRLLRTLRAVLLSLSCRASAQGAPAGGSPRYNFWGYSTVGYYAPMARYSAAVEQGGGGDALINEFK